MTLISRALLCCKSWNPTVSKVWTCLLDMTPESQRVLECELFRIHNIFIILFHFTNGVSECPFILDIYIYIFLMVSSLKDSNKCHLNTCGLPWFRNSEWESASQVYKRATSVHMLCLFTPMVARWMQRSVQIQVHDCLCLFQNMLYLIQWCIRNLYTVN